MAKVKIKISTIDPEVFTHKGLFAEGCYGSKCEDECCVWGCDMDYGTLKVVLKHRDMVEPLIGEKIENCFSTELARDDDYAGGAYRQTRVRDEDDRCAFHLRGEKGCALFYLWLKEGLPKTIVPTICRTYPITWNRGALFVDRPLRRQCKAREAKPMGAAMAPSVWATQKKEVLALFDFVPGLKEKLPEMEERAVRAHLKEKAKKEKAKKRRRT